MSAEREHTEAEDGYIADLARVIARLEALQDVPHVGSCDLCTDPEDNQTYNSSVLFTDSRTGRTYCHECMLMFLSWEMQGGVDNDSELFAFLLISREEEEANEAAEAAAAVPLPPYVDKPPAPRTPLQDPRLGSKNRARTERLRAS